MVRERDNESLLGNDLVVLGGTATRLGWLFANGFLKLFATKY